MRLLVDNSYTMIVDATPDEVAMLDARFSVWRKDRIFHSRYSKERNHPIKLLQGNLLPTGLIEYVIKEFPQLHPVIEDVRKQLHGRQEIAQSTTPPLLPFQQAAVDYCMSVGRALVVARMGAGKTYILGEILRRLCQSTLILVGSKSPLTQIRDRIVEFIKPEFVGLVGAGHKQDNYITIATYPSAKYLPLHEYGCILVDEVHHASAETYQEILKHAAHAYWRFGVTGTLKGRSDGLEILTEAAISSNVYEVPIEMIKEQLGTPTVRVGLIQIKLPFNTLGASAYDELIVNNTAVNNIITILAQRYQERTVLIYVDRIPHGLLLSQLIPGSIFVHGDTSLEDRDAIRRKIQGKVIICTKVFSEAIDTSAISVVINASANKSPITIAQFLGRALRGGADKVVLAFDFIHRDGATFERRSRQRVAIWKKNCDIIANVDLEAIGA